MNKNSAEPPLGLADVSTDMVRHWLENCDAWLDQEKTEEARAARRRQIALLRIELRRRGEKETPG